jgi:peroxiredoxin
MQRNESSYELAGPGRSRQITVSNGHENVRYDSANGQASLTPAIVGTTPQRFGPTPSEFYALPSIAYAWGNRAGLPKPQVRREAGKLILESGSPASSREEIDEQTGFLHHSWSQTGSGFGRENWNFGRRQMENGVILAALVIRCQFNGDKLTMLQVLQLEDVKLKTPPLDVFVVSAPAGTNIVDFRQDRQNPKSEVVKYPVADVVMVANRIPDDDRPILPVLKLGQAAPPLNPFAWLNAEGQTAPPDMKGKVVFVDFWGIFCGPCIAELPEVQALTNVFAKDNFLLIGMHESSAEVAEVAEFARKQSMTYQLAIDRPAGDSLGFGATFKAYGVRAIPSCVVIDQEGRIAYVGRLKQAAIEAEKLITKAKK